jgi:ribonuclease Z
VLPGEEIGLYNHIFIYGPGYTIEGLLMEHGTLSIAYIVRETVRVNVDTSKLVQLGLRPGSWLQQVRGPRAGNDETIVVEGVQRQLKELQDALLVTTPGESVAYLTDFLLDDAAMDHFTAALQGVGTMVCESQYWHDDAELARGNYHMTATQAATLARRANVGQLVLFHLSDCYEPDEWRQMLEEAQVVFPAARFPEQWSGGEAALIS